MAYIGSKDYVDTETVRYLRERNPDHGPLCCQVCKRDWHEGPKMVVWVPDTSGDWHQEFWCLSCIVKRGHLEMLEVKK